MTICSIVSTSPTHEPYTREGQRTGAFRFGDSRATALAGALCAVIHTVTGFTNKSLRGHVAGLLGTDYSSGQMSSDLRRLRLHGLIVRTRLLGPLLDAGDQPPAPPAPRRALNDIDRTINDRIDHARLATAA